MGAEQYGNFYWNVGVVDDLFPGQPTKSDREMCVHADMIEVLPDGTLLASANREEDGVKTSRPNFAWAPGTWRYFNAASVIDGHPVAVEHFPKSRE